METSTKFVECFENRHITYILEKSTHIKFRISVDHINAFHRKLMQWILYLMLIYIYTHTHTSLWIPLLPHVVWKNKINTSAHAKSCALILIQTKNNYRIKLSWCIKLVVLLVWAINFSLEPTLILKIKIDAGHINYLDTSNVQFRISVDHINGFRRKLMHVNIIFYVFLKWGTTILFYVLCWS